MKKIFITVISFIFSLVSITGFAGTPAQKVSKKWDPSKKPSALYDKQGKTVNLKNQTALKGIVLYDKQGNSYKFQNGKWLKFGSQKQMINRKGPGIVA